MRESYGDLEVLKKLGCNKKYSFTIEQLLDENLKNINGESRLEVAKRMEKIMEKIILENNVKKIAIISHGAAIKFFILKYCNLNRNLELEFKGKVISLNSPGILKLSVKDTKIIDIKQIL